MDMTSTLESLSALLTSLSESPYSLELHAKHMHLAAVSDLVGQVEAATQLLTDYHAATSQVWLPFLQQKIQRLGFLDDIEALDKSLLVNSQDITAEALLDVLEWFHKAEKDYLSIPILEKEIKLLIFLHKAFVSAPLNQDLEPLLSEDAVRSAITAAVSQGEFHTTQGHVLWELQIAWELARLAEKNKRSQERDFLITRVESLHLERLKQPHSTHNETLQSYSSFVSNYCNPEEYELRLVSASKLRGGPAKAWDRKEPYELALNNHSSYDTYLSYISSERRVRPQNNILLKTLYGRAINDFACRRWEALVNGSDSQSVDGLESALRSFWCSYIDFMRSEGDQQQEMSVLKQAVRSVSGSGEVWSRYIRTLERIEDDPGFQSDSVQQGVADVYARAFSTSLIQKHVGQIVPLVLAKAGYEKRHMKDKEGFQVLVQTLEDGITMVRKATKEGDPRLTLEKYLVGIFMDLERPLTEQALSLWQSAAKHYKSSSLAWSKYTELLIAQREYTRARALFKDVSYMFIDWPEAIWQFWADFEHLHGSVNDIEHCLAKVNDLSVRLEKKRAQEAAEAQAAWLQASRVITEPHDARSSDSILLVGPGSTGGQQDIDRKRKMEEPEDPGVSSKRTRLDEKAPLKRDRENSTVFVSGLAVGTAEDELHALFKDCGEIREVKSTGLAESLVATVEFMERGSVPAALTKDKKRLKNREIAVHIAWQSTLYVTNFPETSDDAAIRELFRPYGEILDVRWPSKKYKNSRRFCYIQYVSPSAASAALSLHGHEIEPGRKMTVYISNPERKQERSDASANAREIYVAGLNKSVNHNDLKKLLEPYGSINSIRLILDKKGDAKGFAFVEFVDKESASAALAANNQEFKKRRIAVTLADTRVQPRHWEEAATKQARRSRTLRVQNLPPGTQEGLLQQVLEKRANITRVEVFSLKNEAIVELGSIAEAGRLLLNPEPIIFGDRKLQFVEEDLPASTRESGSSSSMFVPRGAAGRPRAGIGSKKSTNPKKSLPGGGARPSTLPEKDQDDFRRMLNTGS